MPVGTGLGLAICRHIATLMGGYSGYQVWMVGEREAGNEFWFTVPLKRMPGEPGLSPPRDETELHRRLPRTRILLVEDIVANQVVTATQLRREGHLVDIAKNGPEAITAVAAHPYDLIFMDIFMPGMNGLETTQHMRGMGAVAANVPVIALTANVTQEDKAQCAAAGMNGMLGKPISLQKLLDVIGSHVWRYRSGNTPADPGVQAAEPSASPMLSANRLEELRTTLPTDTLARLVEDCLAELAERLGLLQQAAKQGERQPIMSQAHAMAGMAAEYGMAALEIRLRALLRAVTDGPGAIGSIIDELDAEMGRTASAMREALHIEMA
jgi:CheY-like chemotaxis protein